jgi:hypothetical protein
VEGPRLFFCQDFPRDEWREQREEYKKCAAECLRWSRIVTNDQSKAMLLQMAATWIKLAEPLTAKAEKEAA